MSYWLCPKCNEEYYIEIPGGWYLLGVFYCVQHGEHIRMVCQQISLEEFYERRNAKRASSTTDGPASTNSGRGAVASPLGE